MKHYLRICAEINLNAVAYNFKSMKDRLAPGTKMIAVVKTDGYGHGAIPIARMVQEYSYIWGFAVATIEEAVLLRNAGIQKPILILGFVFPDAYEDVVRYDIRPAVFKLSMARQLSEEAVRQQKKVYFHIKVDTGMSRIGFSDTEESADIVKEISGLPNVEMEGLFTHFARADEKDKQWANLQFERYQAFSQMLKDRNVPITIHHCSNSAGIYDMPEANMDLVRAGISIYGMYPSDEVNKLAAPIVPVMSLKSHIVYIKELQPGAQISYGGTYVVDHPVKVATIPVGYGDGYPRSLSGKGRVLIRGCEAPIIGRICMDQFMVDVTAISPVRVGDTATIFGRSGALEITADSVAESIGTIGYELTCNINRRVPRVYKKDGKIDSIKRVLPEN